MVSSPMSETIASDIARFRQFGQSRKYWRKVAIDKSSVMKMMRRRSTARIVACDKLVVATPARRAARAAESSIADWLK